MRRRGRALVWLLLALWAALAGADVARGAPSDALDGPLLVVVAGVGGLLAARRPDNPIGWLLLAVALLIGITGVAQGIYTGEDGDLRAGPLGRNLAWLDYWIVHVWIGLIGILIPLLFSDGRPPSPRWRLFLWVSVTTIAVATLGAACGDATVEWAYEGGAAREVVNPSDLAIAASTLAVAALFGPARRRIQGLVDVVAETVAPAHASLWLREMHRP